MNRIERYINAVKNYLPAKNREDVAEELASLLEEEQAAKEASLGRPMNDEELLEWLRGKPHPILAAAGYGEKRTLIGEASFPLYKQTLKVFFLILAIYLAAVSLTQILTLGNYPLTRVFPGLVSHFISFGSQGFALITAVFFLFEKDLSARHWFSHWNPEKLPAKTAKWQSISYTSTAFGIVFTLFFAAWINGILPDPAFQRAGGEALPLFLSPMLKDWLLPINAVILGSLLLSCSHLVRPFWQRWSLIANSLLAFATAWLFWQLSQIPAPIMIADTQALSPDQLEGTLNLLNRVCRNAFRIAVLINLFEGIRDGYRLYKLR